MKLVREAVESSNVRSIGHSVVLQLLEVEFADGAVYRYEDVTAEEHEALMRAPSIGGHLAHEFRPKHPDVWRRVEAKPV